MSNGTAICWQACLTEVIGRIRNQVLVNRLSATSRKIMKISWWEILVNYQWIWCWLSWQMSCLTVTMWTYTIWMTSFAASQKWSGNSEQVFINQLNFWPTSIGKHNSMGHLLPCAIDFKTNHPPNHLQWIGILGKATEPRHVISTGSRQAEVRCDAIVCSAS